MPIEITIPRLGWSADEGTFGGWLKADGDEVRVGDLLFSLESEKATQEIESLDGGVLRIPANGPKPGDTLPVGTVIAYLVAVGEALPAEKNNAAPAAAAVIPAPVRAAAPEVRETNANGPTISPRARAAAKNLGVDWRGLPGSGKTGRIRERDVLQAARAVQPPTSTNGSSLRKVIAERMMQSTRSTAPVTLTTTADATPLVCLRDQFKAAVPQDVPSYNDFLIPLTALTLLDHPRLNSRWDGEQIVLEPNIHIGLAVDAEHGLVVPVVRNALTLGLRELAGRTRDLIERARQRKLRAEETQGGTFTISNLGGFGIDAFTPIIHYPQCAILGVGRIHKQPAVRDNQIVIRDQVTLSLTFDHRIIDGAPAARFLQQLRQTIETVSAPALLLALRVAPSWRNPP